MTCVAFFLRLVLHMFRKVNSVFVKQRKIFIEHFSITQLVAVFQKLFKCL